MSRPGSTSTWCSTTLPPTRPSRSGTGWRSGRATTCTSRRPRRPGSTWSRAGSPCWRSARSGAASSPASRRWKRRSGATSRPPTPIRVPSSGPRAPARSSTASGASVSAPPRQYTGKKLPTQATRMERPLTIDEKNLLAKVFKAMLPYGDIRVRINSAQIGGPDNSITPEGHPYFSPRHYKADFARGTVAEQWIFFHEMTHSWQYFHNISPMLNAAILAIASPGNYKGVYKYDLGDKTRMNEFNIEQQASLVADYFSLSHGGIAHDNTNPSPNVADYNTVIKDFGFYGRATVWRVQGGRWIRTGG